MTNRARIRHALNRMVDRRRLLARVEQAILAYAREHHRMNYNYLTHESAQEILVRAQQRGDHDKAEDCRRWMQLQPPRRRRA